MSAGAKWGLVWLLMATGFCWFEVFQVNNGGRLVFWPEEEDGMFIQTKEGYQILVNGGLSRNFFQQLSL